MFSIKEMMNRFSNEISALDIVHISLAKFIVSELIKHKLIHEADDMVAQNVIIKSLKG